MAERISLDRVTLRFRMSYDRTESIVGALGEAARRMLRRWRPRYFEALRDVSLAVGEGEIVGVIGVNGSGKSTLLRTISGIYHPDAGSVRVSGRVSALLSLGTGFDVRLSGVENARILGLMHGLSLAEIEAMVPGILQFAGIGEFAEVPMKYYSTGMMSRLSFSMIVAMEPDILLIDETLSVGDLQFQEKSKTAMNDLMRRASCQMLVSHDLGLIERACTRVIWMQAGAIIFDGEPAAAVDRYREALQRAAARPSAGQAS